MTIKTREELTPRSGRALWDGAVEAGISELSIEGDGTPIDGIATSISPSDDPNSVPRGRAKPDGREESEPDGQVGVGDHALDAGPVPVINPMVKAGSVMPANSNRGSSRRKAGIVKPNSARAAAEPHSERSDPEKVRLVAEINAVWKRLEEVEDKRVRLREEVDELHLALGEEQRARSGAARALRGAEEREAGLSRDLRKERESNERLMRELLAIRHRLQVQRWEFLAKGATLGSATFGLAMLLSRALASKGGWFG